VFSSINLIKFYTSLCSTGILEGRDHIDFICLLSEMGMVHILSQIWKHLNVEDLGRAQQVCGTWRACLISDRNAGARWKEAREIYMENPHPNRPPQMRARLLKTSPRKALSSVSNILASPTKFEHKRGQDQLPPPVVISPSKYRHKLFTEVTKSVSNFFIFLVLIKSNCEIQLFK
jgi:hypothetical protein